jgi:hypothetical protein
VEARLKFKICEVLKLNQLPLVLKTHDLDALAIFAGLLDELKGLPKVYANFTKINDLHKEVKWRYKTSDPLHHADSDILNECLFNSNDGVITWLKL